jgi:hypothetical protein
MRNTILSDGKIISISFLAYVCLVTYLSPWAQDDYCLGLINWHENSKLTSLNDVIQTVVNGYLTFNPRIGQAMATMISYSGLSPFILLNPPIQLGIGLCIFYMATGRLPIFAGQTDRIMLAVTLMSTYTFVARPGQTVFWMSGALNYSWSFFLVLALMVPYRAIYDGRDIFEKSGKVKYILFCGLAFFAGMTNEGTVIVILFLFIALYLHIRYIQRTTIPRWFYLGVAFLILGLVFMMSAPGIIARLHAFKHYDEYSNLSILQRYSINKSLPFLKVVGETLLPLLVFYSLVTIASIIYAKKHTLLKVNILAAAFISSGAVMVLVLINTPIAMAPEEMRVYSRSLYGGSVMLVIYSIMLLNSLNNHQLKRHLQALVLLSMLGYSVLILKPYFSAYAWERISFYFTKTKPMPTGGVIEVPTYDHSGWLDYIISPPLLLTSNPDFFINTCYASYWAIPYKIKGIPNYSLWD